MTERLIPEAKQESDTPIADAYRTAAMFTTANDWLFRIADLERQLSAVTAEKDLLLSRALIAEAERDALKEQLQFPPPKGKFYCHPDEVGYWLSLKVDAERYVHFRENCAPTLLLSGEIKCSITFDGDAWISDGTPELFKQAVDACFDAARGAQ